jgi:methylenetetrahydrofolate dehydrogenase (NADP+)/methenyltetrahydrofolate cyclohydrolase
MSSKDLVQEKLKEFSKKIQQYRKKNIISSITVILVGNNPNSLLYIQNKKKLCESIGIIVQVWQVDESISLQSLKKIISKINADKNIQGILLQFPLPKTIKETEVMNFINENKDIDGFHRNNIFKLYQGDSSGLIPCTPKGIVQLLKYYNIPMSGENVLIINRSFLVGKPLALLLSLENATTTIAHSSSKNIESLIQQHSIIISAIGQPHYFPSKLFSQHHILVDVGITKKKEHFFGDIEKDKLNVRAYTPVPGGVGPMTVLSLIDNFLICLERQYEI